MAINDGGPAYPLPVNDEQCRARFDSGYGGMSLRDAFAIAVAGDIWMRFQSDGTAQRYDNWREGVAVEAYRLADEMLEVSNRTQDTSHEQEEP